jgi:high-affinity iron transporter
MNAFIIAFRECLEASLIIGILYTLIHRYEWHQLKKGLAWSVALAILASIGVAWILDRLIDQMGNEGPGKLAEAIFFYITAGFLLYVIFWLSRTVSSRKKLEDKVLQAQGVNPDSENAKAAKVSGWGLYVVSFFAVLREGFETVLFLRAGASMNEGFSYVGFFSGIILAAGLGYLIVLRGRKMNLRPFFKWSTFALVLFAAGMVAYATHEFEEYLVKSGQLEKSEITKVYSILKPGTEEPTSAAWMYQLKDGKYYHAFHDKGSVGVYLKGFFGYNSDPNPVEVLLWFLSLALGIWLWRTGYRQSPAPARTAEAKVSSSAAG